MWNVLRDIWRHPSNKSQRVRAIARGVRFQVRGHLLHKPTLARVGTRSYVWAHLHRSASSLAVYANPPDHPEMLVWRDQLRPGDVFIDVGANIGAYAIWAAEIGATVIALEPAPDTCELLRENVRLNGYDIDVRECAAGAEDGHARFTRDQDVVNRLDPCGAATVAVVALDSIIGDTTVAGMKVDVEGFEIEVLRGCRRALAERRIRLLQLEWNTTSEAATGTDRKELAALLGGYGYELLRPDASGELVNAGASPPYGRDVFCRPR